MIKQPEWGNRNISRCFYEEERKQIAKLNEIFKEVDLSKSEMQTLVWLAGWDENTVTNIISAIRKVITTETQMTKQVE